LSSRANNRFGGSRLGLLLFLALILFAAGCRQASAPPAAVTATVPPVHTVEAQAPAPPDSTGTPAVTQTSAKREESHPSFDGARAFAELKKQCDFGPRPLGTEAHEKLKDYLRAEMQKYADSTITQEFKYRNMPVTNIIGVFYPAGSEKPSAQPVLLMAHWDTRPISDGPYSEETLKGVQFHYGQAGWSPLAPIPGADDGASGVAVMLELARMFHQHKPPVGVLLLFDDGEDYGDFEANNREGEGVMLGARYFAQHFRDNPVFGKPDYGILLDMVGAKGMILPREQYSQMYAPGTNEKVFGIAQSLGYGNIFLNDQNQSVEDDHFPLNAAGIPTIDLIHPLPYGDYKTTGYQFWHTRQDSPDKCSADSLKVVGATVAEVIYREMSAP
jgi:hypothetical protein